ncbi:hypothetical protein F5Y15DRAFT_386734 [Xylariaceae sp. FL0016]|nr:hypothetical protein F5Y15DRAFT_386734 [Xylariaceae sp. FL0016]
MSAKKPAASPMSPSSVASTRPRSHRDSVASSISPPSVDKEQIAQALDKIHTSAKEQDVLTTFNSLSPPTDSAVDTENKGLTGDLVQNGFSGLYSRFKEAVGGSSARDKTASTTGLDVPEMESQSIESRRTSGPSVAAPKSTSPSLLRADTGITNSTFNSTTSDPMTSTLGSSSAAYTSEGQSQQPQSTKASSVNNFTTAGTSKSASSSRQSIPNMTKSAAVVAPVNVSASAFKEGPRISTVTAEEIQNRIPTRKSLTKASDSHLGVAIPAASTFYDETKSAPAADKAPIASRSRHEDSYSVDGNVDAPVSPVKASGAGLTGTGMPQTTASEPSLLSPPPRMSTRDAARRPAVIERIRSGSHSRSSSVSRGTAEPSPVSTSAHHSVRHDSFAPTARSSRMKSGEYRIPGTTAHEGAPEAVNAKLESMRKQVLSKDFWMADETCKECFLCGAQFSAFRRKHHCRTCGCIFDSKCTTTIPGQRFGVQSSLRVCKPCLAIILQRQDGNASDDSADDSYLPAIFRSNPTKSSLSSVARQDVDNGSISERTDEGDDDSRSMSTPMMAIPAARRLGESSNRNSAVLEIDAPQLSRPSSSRSLRSMNSRPQSGHRRHHSKHNLWNRLKPTPDERAPFRKSANDEIAKRPGLPAFHDDNVIDPDLAAYMSDESSGDEQMSIMGAVASSEQPMSGADHERTNLGSYLGAGRRLRSRTQADKSVSGFSFTSRGADELHPRSSRRRNLSVASGHQGHHLRSPRPRSAAFKGPSASNETLPIFDSPATHTTSRLTRSSSMRGDKEPRLELNPASLSHVRKLLRQLLQDADVPNVVAWEKALIPILLKCTTAVDPDIGRDDAMDIRHYVKLKKIPGGRPSDTSYVSGVIFTKKLALKAMPRRMHSPRVVIVSFPIEYQRHRQHFMSLQPVIEQEREFLKQLVNRIVALRPQLLLAEKSVSGLALQFLSEANIAVAYNVKPSVLSAVSRCLETDIISSVDMLAIPPPQFQPGKSTGFEVKTFVNDEIPGRKKTYIFLSSHQEDLGCTIALRGAPTPILRKLKYITEFMVYVVYNLKLESCLMRDSFIQLPTSEDLVSSSSRLTDEQSSELRASGTGEDRQRTFSTMTLDDQSFSQQSTSSGEAATDQVPQQSAPQDLSQNIRHTDKLISLHESHGRASSDSLVPEDLPMPTFYSDMVAKYETKILSASPFVKFAQPYLLMRAREQERRLVHLKRLRDQDIVDERVDEEKPKPQKFQLIKPEMVHQPGHQAPRQIMEILHAVHDAEYDKALYNYQTQTRSWENYIQGNLDLFNPYAHQNIVVLHSIICTATKIPCAEPCLLALGFYNENPDENNELDPDCTLGQYIAEICEGAETICDANGCDRKMFEHHRTYVHGEARLTVFVEQETKSKSRGDNLMMWSFCKICKRETSEMVMSKGTWKYSFGKYLELSFWSRGTHLVNDDDLDGWNCPHDHHRDHIRYFGWRDKVVRIHYDPIDLLEIIVPRARITWKVENDLKMKNEIFTHCQDRWARFTTSVKARLKAIKLDNILPEKAEACKAEVDRLTKKIQEEHTTIIRKLQDKYVNSKYYEVIPFNIVLREMLVKATEWDAAFAKFEADFLPSDKDIRRLTMIQLRKMFTDESKESLSSNDASTDVTDIVEKPTQPNDSESESKTDMQPADISIETPQPDVAAEKAVEVPPQELTLSSAAEVTLGRVEPLDLATPTSPAPNLALATQSRERDETPTAQQTPKTPAILDDTPTPTPSAVLNEKPLPSAPDISPDATSTMSVSEQVEQLRRKQHIAVLETASGANLPSNTQAEAANPDTVKPPTERGPSRRVGLNVSPPMVRAISQPAHSMPTLPRAHSGIGKKMFSKDRDKGHSLEALTGNELRKAPTGDLGKGEKKMFGLKSHRKGGQSSIPRFVGKKDSRVSTIRKHFEQLSREFEKEREKDRKKRAARMSHSRPFLQHSTTKAIVEVYQDVDDAVQEPGPIEEHVPEKEYGEPNPTDVAQSSMSSSVADVSTKDLPDLPQSPTDTAQRGEETVTEVETDDQTQNTSIGPTDDEQGDSDTEQSIIDGTTLEEIAESLDSSTEIPLELPKHDKMNFMKALTSFWNERSASQWPSLEYPLNSTDHIFIDSDIIVREDEPSSVIAFALSCDDYEQKRHLFHRRKPGAPEPTDSDHSYSDVDDRTETYSDVGGPIPEVQLETSLVHTTSSHFKYQFTEGSARMLVKIFYAEQFDALRRKCGVADRIVESLSRCMKWDSKGGKTKSVFLKTQDDRLVMKSLLPIETAAFLKFAPAYFSIMAEALFHDLPSVIAKMVGFFQVVIKNPVTNTEIRLDLLVMENLFYDRSPDRIFDLKGSMRNRKIQSTGEQNEVLLDENMVEYIYESPLFAREHSKKLLKASVFNDTLFLARQKVMDYSLMIAVDETKRELVVGIIDCIRTYTWDKKLESWIKDLGLAGGGRNRPTVTSPKEYKSRFREAMARYILQAPNCWHQFHTPLMALPPRGEDNTAGEDAMVTNMAI